MGQHFYKGRTNNHLTWVMVDATDFATPESALSAAMTIKIYGKLRGATGVNFVSSGTGSLTNDVQHVGASATGTYTIALAKADLSDASAAWYDQYTIILAGTGAAQQVLVVDGGIDNSTILALSDLISNAYSAAVVGSSRALLNQSLASDAHSAATQANSRILLVQSRLSDLDSRLVSDVSDIRSAIALITVTASDVSDILSAVAVGNSRALINQSRISDVYSLVSNINSLAASSPTASDIASKVWAETIALLLASRVSDIQSALSDAHSDIKSAIAAGPGATITASDMSDIASRVRVLFDSDISDLMSRTTQINSRVILVQSRLSDLDSRLSSDVSDILSAIAAGGGANYSSELSDIMSRLALVQSTSSDAHSAALATQSMASDIYSLLSDLASDVTVISGVLSDVRSDITRGVNIRAVNGVTVNGDGSGTPWGP